MTQAAILILIFLMFILFGAQNMHQTRINFPLVGGFETQTVFLLLLFFFLGFTTATFFWLGKQIKKRKKPEPRKRINYDQ